MQAKRFRPGFPGAALALGALLALFTAVAPVPTAAQTGAPFRHVILFWGNTNVPSDPNNPFGLAPVLVFSDRVDIAAYALEQYFKGPPPEVAATGFYADVDTGPITDGKVFTLALDGDAATVDIVQPVTFFGDLSQGRLVTAITWTLTQFSPIDRVVVLLNGQPLSGSRGR